MPWKRSICFFSFLPYLFLHFFLFLQCFIFLEQLINYLLKHPFQRTHNGTRLGLTFSNADTRAVRWDTWLGSLWIGPHVRGSVVCVFLVHMHVARWFVNWPYARGSVVCVFLVHTHVARKFVNWPYARGSVVCELALRTWLGSLWIGPMHVARYLWIGPTHVAR
jgi:hypothetical protein